MFERGASYTHQGEAFIVHVTVGWGGSSWEWQQRAGNFLLRTAISPDVMVCVWGGEGGESSSLLLVLSWDAGCGGVERMGTMNGKGRINYR